MLLDTVPLPSRLDLDPHWNVLYTVQYRNCRWYYWQEAFLKYPVLFVAGFHQCDRPVKAAWVGAQYAPVRGRVLCGQHRHCRGCSQVHREVPGAKKKSFLYSACFRFFVVRVRFLESGSRFDPIFYPSDKGNRNRLETTSSSFCNLREYIADFAEPWMSAVLVPVVKTVKIWHLPLADSHDPPFSDALCIRSSRHSPVE